VNIGGKISEKIMKIAINKIPSLKMGKMVWEGVERSLLVFFIEDSMYNRNRVRLISNLLFTMIYLFRNRRVTMILSFK